MPRQQGLYQQAKQLGYVGPYIGSRDQQLREFIAEALELRAAREARIAPIFREDGFDETHYQFSLFNINKIGAAFIRAHLARFSNLNWRFALLQPHGDNYSWKIPKGGNIFSPENLVSYIHSTLTAYYDLHMATFQLYRNRSKPVKFELGTAPEINCIMAACQKAGVHNVLIQSIHDELMKKELYTITETNIQPAFRDIMDDKYHEAQVTRRYLLSNEGADLIAKRARININIYHALDQWYTTDAKKNTHWKNINLFASDSHCEIYEQPRFYPANVVYLPTIAQVAEEFAKPENWGMKKPTIKYERRDGEIVPIITSFIYKNTMYKAFKPDDKYANDQKYFNCTNELSFEFKKWTLENRLSAPRGVYYDIIKSATHFLNNYQFENFDMLKQYYNYDMRKAFPSFNQSPFYNEYKLPAGNYNIFSTDYEGGQELALEMLSKPGWSTITNIVYLNPLIESIQWIQPNCRYTNLRLRFILDNNLATFTITDFTIAESDELNLPFKPFDDNKENKSFNVSFVGRMVAGGKDAIRVTPYVTRDELEAKAYEFSCSQNKLEYVSTKYGDMHVIEVHEPDLSKKGLWQVYSYILDYQQTTFVKAMIAASKETKIIGYNVDGFYTSERLSMEFEDKFLGPNQHQFKHTFEPIKSNLSTDLPIHDKFITSENNIKPPVLKAYINRLNGNTFTYGPAGCYKTQVFIDNPLVGACMGAPTHLLKAGHIERFNSNAEKNNEEAPMQVNTVHKSYALNKTKNKPVIEAYESVIVDEGGMLSQEIVNILLKQHRESRTNLYMMGDIDPVHGNQQLETAFGTPMTAAFINRNFKWYAQDLSKRRQSLEEAKILDSVRYHSFNDQMKILKTIIPSDRFIKWEKAVKMFDKDSIAVSFTNKRCMEFNKEIQARKDIDFYKVKNLKHPSKKDERNDGPKGRIHNLNRKDHKSNDIYWDLAVAATEEDPIPSEFNYLAAYMATADSVQGATFSEKIFIDLKFAKFRNGFIYTAISRCTSVSNLYFIEDDTTFKLKDNESIELNYFNELLIKKDDTKDQNLGLEAKPLGMKRAKRIRTPKK